MAGLGNPGPKYEDTRHNLGFRVVDELARRSGAPGFQQKFDGLFAERGGGRVLLVKPQTFMNLSGECVAKFAGFYKIPPEAVLIVTDDIDLPPGQLRLRKDGGPGGHNGMKSVIESLGTELFPRVRLGVGRSSRLEPKAFVLARIAPEERALFDALVLRAADAVEAFLGQGMDAAMNAFNRPPEGAPA